MSEMYFVAKRVTNDPEGTFVVGKEYLANITDMDFEYKGIDSMELHLSGNGVDMEGLWGTSEFQKEFSVVKLKT